ncbi:uncharacterized protein LOC128174123 [Crassostrea angulata]|uniref:uncharacterized protein LOC128174123 n=1 Tax=Magallana angulata TaxID=2784310 RepID=UPI0022B0D28D|nr:uncharacterized protein LOC128174123 [Crassostrea angulata]
MRRSCFLCTSLRLASFFLLALQFCKADLRYGYSMLQYGHKLERRMITSYDGYSILDCVEDCLRTTRCRSVNYHQGGHFCQTNFKSRTTEPTLYKEKSGWIYSDKEDWDKGIAGSCSKTNCALNEKCISKPFGQSSCVLSDCGIPSWGGFSMNEAQEWDAIGISRRIHITCAPGYKKQGSEQFVCLSDGTWKTDVICSLEGCPVPYTGVFSNSKRAGLQFVATSATYLNARCDCAADGGDLIKIDTQTMLRNFLNFIETVLYAPSQSTTNLRHSYSMLQYGHKLDRRMITSYDGYSILDCVEDCLRTTRCQSVNYHQGAHFCQTNFETNVSSPDLYLEKPGWIYSARSDWDKFNGVEEQSPW